jgi:hypothetical protein
MITVGESISRVRNILKGVKEDAFLTDRAIYYNIIKYGRTLLKREDNQNKLMRMNNIISTIPYMELIDVDIVEAGCKGIHTNVFIKRTKDKLPAIFQGSYGPLIRTVGSLDDSDDLMPTQPSLYTKIIRSTNFKYNKSKYYWYMNGYIYVPNVDWEAIKIEALFEGNIGELLCDPKEQCKSKQEQLLPFPEYLFSEIEQFVIKEMAMTLQIQEPGADDSQNPHR